MMYCQENFQIFQKENKSSIKSINNRSSNPELKSLHYFQKKQEFERIDKENNEMFKRITSQGSTISLKKMREDYNKKK